MQLGQTLGQRLMLGLWCLVLASTYTACAPQLLGPTVPSKYVFTLEASPDEVWLGAHDRLAAQLVPTTAAIVVRVQDGQGHPVDGVAVAFALEPLWAQSAVLSPAQTVTRGGVARALFTQPQTTGRVRLTVRVDNTIAQTTITVHNYEEPREQES